MVSQLIARATAAAEWDNDIDYCDELPGTSYGDPLTPAAVSDPEVRFHHKFASSSSSSTTVA